MIQFAEFMHAVLWPSSKNIGGARPPLSGYRGGGQWPPGPPYYVCTLCMYVCMQAFGSFPREMSVLDLESDLEWNPEVSTINSSPLAIYDDGAILYFKYVL